MIIRHHLRTVLVTGGCGFIGSHLIRHLLETDATCVVVNLDALTYAGSRDRVADVVVQHPTRYHFYHGDICDEQLVGKIFRTHEPDTVLHLAAESHVDRAIACPGSFLQTNVLGTMTLLTGAQRAWTGRTDVRFHQVSTDEVFGSLPPQGYFTEESPYCPNNPYSASKAAADHLVRAWQQTYGLPVTMSYGTNTYGPGQYPEKLIPLAISRAIEEQPIPLYGDGLNIRDWMHVADHVRGITTIVRSARNGERFLVGSQQEVTNRDLLDTIAQQLDRLRPRASGASYRELITSVQDRAGHDRRYASDCTRIRESLHWHQQVPLEAGLENTIRWHLNLT